MTKNIAILGSTGTIGTQALNMVRNDPDIQVCALAALRNVKKIEDQSREFKPQIVALYDERAAADLKVRLKDTDIRVLAGLSGVCEAAAAQGAEITLNAVIGMVGLMPTIEAIKAKKRIALANKETLVTAGKIIMSLAAQYDVPILPVDSEHSAIFQCLNGAGDHSEIQKIILTASGGPFFGEKTKQLQNVTVEQALRHPNWSMGSKITIDSATMMNKGLEFIEAMHLFSVTPEQIDILVHRESIIHSMVEFCDHSVIAQLSVPDMTLPIQYAVYYPKRMRAVVKPLDLVQVSKLTFFKPDMETFIALPLAIGAAKEGGTACAVLNGANEAAVSLFLAGKIGFLDIARRVETALFNHKTIKNPSLEDVLNADQWAREKILYNL